MKNFIKFNDYFIRNNGDLGWINSNALSKNILDVIKDLKKWNVSSPIILVIVCYFKNSW